MTVDEPVMETFSPSTGSLLRLDAETGATEKTLKVKIIRKMPWNFFTFFIVAERRFFYDIKF